MTKDAEELYDFISSSKFRANIMWHLWSGDESRPVEIVNERDYPRQRVSEALTELEERGLVECVNPEGEEKARWYRITELGREVWLPPRDDM